MNRDYIEYNFGEGNEIPLDDINIPDEVRDYITNICDVEDVIYEMYPEELINRNMIMSVFDSLQSECIEFQSFHLYEKMQYNVFNQSIILYEKKEDVNGYMIYKNILDNVVLLIKV